jgi:hypothetical protein
MGVTIRAYGIIGGSVSYDMIKQIISNVERANIKLKRLSSHQDKLVELDPSIDIEHVVWQALNLPQKKPYVWVVCYHLKLKLEFSFFLEKIAPEQNQLGITSMYPRALRKFRIDTETDIGFYVQALLDLSKGLSLRDLDTAYY